MIWREFAAVAPEMARLGRDRFEGTRVALIATIRRDGSPRISPIEPVLAAGHLLLGCMPSAKVGDLERDPRCTLHSAVCDVNGSEAEFQLHGRAEPAADDALDADYDAWWKHFPPDRSRVFELDIAAATLIRWNTAAGELETMRWSPSVGVQVGRRRYP